MTKGIRVLHDALRRHPDSPEAWDAWLTGLSLTPDVDRLNEEFARLPKATRRRPSFRQA